MIIDRGSDSLVQYAPRRLLTAHRAGSNIHWTPFTAMDIIRHGVISLEKMAMRTLGMTLLVGLGGYITGVVAGIILVNLFSSNRFDRAQEAIMTGLFAVGPLVGLLCSVGYLAVHWLGKKMG
jgi:hypothetical protein